MRSKIVAGNWKMFGSAASARELVAGIAPAVAAHLAAQLGITHQFIEIDNPA